MSEREREPGILPVRPGTLNEKDKARLRRAGIVVIEHDNPAELRLLRIGLPEVDAGDMLFCAIEALTGTSGMSDARFSFVKALAASMQARRATPAPEPQP